MTYYSRYNASERAVHHPITGSELRRAREAAGLSHWHIAEALQVLPKHIHEWETGCRDIPRGLRSDLVSLFPLELLFLEAPDPDQSLREAKQGEFQNWWGDVVITFRGSVPSIVRSISGHTHQKGWGLAWRRENFLSFTDMSGRFILVNRAHVERLQLLDEGDDRPAADLLIEGHDSPAYDPLAAFLEPYPSGTTLEFDYALSGLQGHFFEELPTAGEIAFNAQNQIPSDLSEVVERAGALATQEVVDWLEQFESPNDTLSLFGRTLHIHLRSGACIRQPVGEEVLAMLATAADEFEDLIFSGVKPPTFLTTEDPDHPRCELIAWREIAWIETSAVDVDTAFADLHANEDA